MDKKQKADNFDFHGTSEDVIPSLLTRIRHYAPDAYPAAQIHFKSAAPHRSYDGKDAAACMLLHLLEAMSYGEQLRMELAEQTEQHNLRMKPLPSKYYILMTELLSMEASLSESAAKATKIHALVWDERLPGYYKRY